MKKLLVKLHAPFKLSVLSLITTIFLLEGSSKCGAEKFGLPLRFIQTKCNCANHIFPIDFLHLGIDILYHMIIWGVLIYLLNDAKETWQMFKGRKINSSPN